MGQAMDGWRIAGMRTMGGWRVRMRGRVGEGMLVAGRGTDKRIG